ncbi:MAG: hypothetical protein R6U98_02880 [Pirellulaceae bacterium]
MPRASWHFRDGTSAADPGRNGHAASDEKEGELSSEFESVLSEIAEDVSERWNQRPG